jgi:hypothetical protein
MAAGIPKRIAHLIFKMIDSQTADKAAPLTMLHQPENSAISCTAAKLVATAERLQNRPKFWSFTNEFGGCHQPFHLNPLRAALAPA